MLLQRYRIDALLGRGGMSTVYRGVQLSVKRPVAIKLIARGLTRESECVQRFRREAEAMAQLQHPNTVRIYEFGVTEQDELFIVMELLEGRDLAELLSARGSLSVREAISITRQTLEALWEAHALGIVHRDLKPANIFLSQLPRAQLFVKVLDFGIAGLEDTSDEAKLTRTGIMMGTPAYMSPEQVLGKRVDARSDLYSLGITLYEMLAGRPPFDEQQTASVLISQVSGKPPTLSEVCPERMFPPPLQAALDRMLAKDPDQRPASAEEALALLESIPLVDDEPTRALVAVGMEAPADAAAQTVADTSQPANRSASNAAAPVSVARTTPQVGRRGVPLAAACVTLVAGLLVFANLRASESEPPKDVKAEAMKPAPAQPALRSVRIASTPSGARVLSNGLDLGATPYELWFRAPTDVTLVREGYRDTTLHITNASEHTLEVELPVAEEVLAAAADGDAPAQALKASASGGESSAKATPRTAARERAQPRVEYRNVAEARRAEQSGKLSPRAYREVVRNLKVQRAERLQAAKQAYRRRNISRAEYNRRVREIETAYAGPRS